MQVVLDNLPFVVVLVASVIAPITGWFAARRSRQPAIWFVLGALLGPLALLLLAIAPPGRCPACEGRISGWAGWCPHCGTRLPAVTAALIGPPPRPASPPPISVQATPMTSLDAVVDRRPRLATSRTVMPLLPPPVPELVPDPAVAGSEAPAAATVGEVLSTGIYLAGNAKLEIGACYALSRIGERWRVFGPVDAGQITVRHEGALDALEVTAMDDRVILSSGEGRSSVAIVLRPIGGMRAADLERALAAGPRRGGSAGVAR